MKIDVKLSLDSDFLKKYGKENQSANVASGWVELENAIKFPVRVLQTKDKIAFTKYPQVNTDGQWNNILFPVDKDVKDEIDAAVLDEMRMQIFKELNVPDITRVRVTILPEEENPGKVAVKAMATIYICGCAINGISVKESANGLFVQMPQYRDSEGKFHDYVYGTNKYVQAAINESVLGEYQKQLELAKTPNQPSPNVSLSK
ncbi:MAG: septation protein SpoVG family protein [Agathobacter sp.]